MRQSSICMNLSPEAFLCTEAKGHDGDHVASCFEETIEEALEAMRTGAPLTDRVVSTWPQGSPAPF